MVGMTFKVCKIEFAKHVLSLLMRPAHGGLTGMGGFTGMVAFDGNGFLDFALCEGCGWFEELIGSVAFWDQLLEFLANQM